MTVSPPRPLRRAVRLAVTTATTAAVLSGMLTVATVSSPAVAAGAGVDAVDAAASYARSSGYTVGISVLDTRTGAIYHSGDYSKGFASESVIKVLIAARLLVQGRMHGSTDTRASRMIRMSDDNIANSFYGSVGGDGLLDWAKKYFKVPSLGSGPIRSNWWGSNRLTSDGLVRLYAQLKGNGRIGPWLLKAMHGHTTYGADGFYQAFGLPSATSNAAVKQGWGADYSYSRSNASQNSTGFVNGDRYAVAILARGPGSSYGSRIGNAITVMAKRLLPGGTFPGAGPGVTSLTSATGSTAGGYWVGVRGTDFVGVTGVKFGSTPAPRVIGKSRGYLLALVPKHDAGAAVVSVSTRAGTSPASGPRFTFGAPPTISSMYALSGPTSGGGIVYVRGTNLSLTLAASFDGVRVPTHRISATLVAVGVPRAATAKAVYVRVQTAYGLTAWSAACVYTYVDPAATGTTQQRTATPSSTPSTPAPDPTPASSSTASSSTPSSSTASSSTASSSP